MNNDIEMPKYQCHKQVWALKILDVCSDSGNGAVITPEEKAYAPFKVNQSFIEKHHPQPGGYYVVYKDGYKSYSPAEPFENGYARLSELTAPTPECYQKNSKVVMDEKTTEQKIQEKGLNAPRLNSELIDSKIVDTQFHVFDGTCLTVCCITLKNGFTVIGESSCVSPENFDAEIGRDVAFDDARRKIWALEGYLLKQKIYDGKLTV